MTRSSVSTTLFLVAALILFGIGGAAENRALNSTDAVLALTSAGLILLGAWIEKGRAQ